MMEPRAGDELGHAQFPEQTEQCVTFREGDVIRVDAGKSGGAAMDAYTMATKRYEPLDLKQNGLPQHSHNSEAINKRAFPDINESGSNEFPPRRGFLELAQHRKGRKGVGTAVRMIN
ncbi:hypothetical protein R1sor_024719 [Riccia sorocarpa]|uniref:Uncharacterized protein n=1 Tax=Riccia sorocarpa TaxID=122646 RepID=A0ABD3GRG2_9MARC